MPSLAHRSKKVRVRGHGPPVEDRTRETNDEEEAPTTNDDNPQGEQENAAEDDPAATQEEQEQEQPGNDDSDKPAEGDGGDEKPATNVQEIQVQPGQALKIVLASPDTGKPIPKKEHPQVLMNKFWQNFEPEYEGGVTQILPDTFTKSTGRKSDEASPTAVHSYEQAREQCIKQVKRIVRECRTNNQKYTDTHFDLERDLKITGERYCLDGLVPQETPTPPKDVKRIPEIFEKPQFYKDGAGFDDIMQGYNGDCWMLAGLSALTANEDLLRKICVIQDQEVGVYGFVFHRDGEWHPCIIDDKLYLKAPAYDEDGNTGISLYGVRQKNEEKRYNRLLQQGSKALYFAACRDENETWVPLLEKAFAKAHGDYSALSGGYTGEAIEDLTGGITTEIYTTSILSKDRFWQDLQRIGKDFVFSGAAAVYLDWQDQCCKIEEDVRTARRKGVISRHAYAVLDTFEGFGQRLVKMRNPWGWKEWSGAWSDGSKEWTSEWFQRLNHKFGDDGVFWMSYHDMLNKYKYIDRTRLFGPEWHLAQQWVRVQVPWNTRDYQQTRFSLEVPKDTEAVISLSQLDTRYFIGFQGIFDFTLQFRLQNDADEDDDYVARSKLNYELSRSTNVEVELEKGTYTILFKVAAEKTDRSTVEKVIRENYKEKKDKITQIATLYDLAFAKGQLPKPDQIPTADKAEASSSETGKGDADNDDDGDNGIKKTIKRTNTQYEDAATEIQPSGKEEAGDDPDKDKAKKETKEESTQTTDDTNKATPDDDDPDRNPWNAFCVVGLRVFSKLADLKVKLVVPSEEKSMELDRDDIAKAPNDEAQAQNPPNGGEESSDDDDDDDE